MAPIRPKLRAVLLVGPLVALLGAAFVGCDTGAIGVESCRSIETARCDAAPTCFGDEHGTTIETEQQVANCKVYYRDHCLVGLETTVEPETEETEACVAAVQAAAACKAENAATIADCTAAPAVRDGSANASPCEVLATPELLSACAFIEAPEGAGGGA